MTYHIEAVDRELLPDGRDWMFVEEPNGDQHFVMANDAHVVLPDDALVALLAVIAEHANLPLRVAS